MTILELLADLRSKDVALWAEGDRLRLRGGKDVLNPQVMATLKARKDEIMARLEDEARERAGAFPLAPGQLGIWNARTLRPDAPDYNVHAVLRLAAGTDVDRLRAALDATLAHHPMLRARFARGDDGPRQQVMPAAAWPFASEAIDGLDEAVVAGMVDTEIDRPFDPGESVVRAKVLREDATSGGLLVLTLHHLAADFWSLGLVVRDIAAAYQAASPFADESSPEYRDFIAAAAARPATPEDWAFWDAQLGSDLPHGALPRAAAAATAAAADDTAPPARTIEHALEPALVAELRTLAQSLGITPFALMVATFEVALGRFTQSDETVVGIPFAGRTDAGADACVGHFVSMLPLRSGAIAGDFAAFAKATARRVAEAIAHQSVGFEAMVQRYARHRRPGRMPLFDIVVNWNKELVSAAADGAGLFSAFLRGGSTGAHGASHDLVLSVIEHAGGERMSLRWTHRPEAYEAATVAALANALHAVLRGMIADPARAIAALPLLDAVEADNVLGMGSGPPSAPLEHIVDTIERLAREQPAAAALSDRDETLSFAEMNARANRLAGYLLRSGVGAGATVALRLPRAPDFAVAALAVLKAGAAYVPIDLMQPEARVAEIAAEAGSAMLLTQSQDAMVEHAGGFITEFVDLVALRTMADPGEDHAIARPLDALAYIVFTSGTGGRPKGSITTHRGLANLVDWYSAITGAAPGKRAGQLVSNGFDACILDLWTNLGRGAEIRFIPPDEMVSPQRLPALIDALGIDICFVATVVYEMAADAAWREVRRPLTVVTGGSALRTGRPSNPAVRLFNAYGPSEASVAVTIAEVTGQSEERYPIGRAVPGVTLRLLDQRKRPVPVGAIGELHIGGVAVGGGYIGQPALTATAFVPDATGGRLYATGDFARFLPDGQLDFLGRREGQAKLAGFRVELGEIEQKLMRHPAVRLAALAIARSDGHERLVGVWVPGVGEASAPQLIGALAAELPGYMIPAKLVAVDELPMTPSGKVDRAAVLDLVAAHADEIESETFSSALEEQVAAIWADVLGVDVVAPHASFFELGGHSLLAVQLVERINDALGSALQVGDLMRLQTVASVAAQLGGSAGLGPVSGSAGRDRSTLVRSDEDRRHDPFPLTDTQYAYWIGRNNVFELGNVATHIYTELELDVFDVDAVNAVWNRLIARHDMLRAVVSLEGTQRILRQVPGYAIAVDDFTALDADTQHERLLATRERMSHQVFDPQHWPLFEIRLSRLAPDRFRLHTSIDALIADARSFATIEAEYDAIARGEAETLPPLGISFRDYVLAERALAEGPAHARASDYWLKRLDTLPSAPDLPLARDPQMLADGRFQRFEGRLGAGQWRALKAQARALGITSTTLLLTAFSEVLRLWSQQPAFTLNLTLFNRIPLHADVDNIVGDFTSLTLLEVDARAGATFADRAQGLQQRMWDDIEHRLFSGVQVLRELSRRNGGQRVIMPVVFTSILPLDGPLDASLDGPLDGAAPATPAAVAPDAGEKGFTITQTSQVWIDHVVAEDAGALVYHWDVVAELFPDGMVADMIASYRTLLDRLADAADTAWSSGGLLPPARQIAAMAAANATAAPVSGRRMEDAVLAQAAARPDAPAIVWDGGQMRYGELAERAFHLAHRLRELGVVPGMLVGMLLPRGWEQAVAALGIQLAGGAYLPLNVDWPTSRQEAVLDAGGAGIVVTRPDLAAALPDTPGREIVTLTHGEHARSTVRPDPVGSDADTAYVIFTSGSTGQPKGVAIDHRGAVNTIADVNARFGVEPGDRALALSALSFDLSVWDIYGLLSAGGALVVPADDAIRNPELWHHHLTEHGVTILNAVPSFLQMLADYQSTREAGERLALRLVMMSGDWIPVTLPDRLREFAPDARIVSLGGATEASIWSVFHPIDVVDPSWASIPYGRPLANQTLHVLKTDFTPCPDWVAGDLYIGGLGLAQGYWGDAERTNAAFVINPRDGARLYRTGDLARYVGSGLIEFLGRRDTQVKVRGHRIELGEIEAVLAAHEDVRAAVAIAVGKGENRAIRAFVVPADGTTKALFDNAGGVLDYLGDVADVVDPSYIDDPAERIMFKFAGHGLRRFAEDAPRIGCADAGVAPTLALFGTADERVEEAAVVDRMLAAMRQKPLDDSPIAKRLYGSAGSLYPIQLHLLGGDGAFYYDPAGHQLVGLDAAAGGAAPAEFVLVAEDQAIRPLYGTLARDLCLVEAGGIAQTLDAVARSGGYRLERVAEVNPAGLRQRLGLRASQWPAARLRLVPMASSGDRFVERDADWLDRQSYRTFETGSIEAVRVRGIAAALTGRPGPSAEGDRPPLYEGAAMARIFLKPGRVHGIRPGLYDIAAATGELRPVAEDEADIRGVFPGDAAALYADAAFVVFLTGTAGDAAGLIEAGAMSQQLMLAAGLHGLGFCPVGQLDQRRLAQILPAMPAGSVLYTLVGGAVSDAARRRWIQVEQPDPAQLFERILRDHARRFLPDYMIPETIALIDEVPLSANGKVDRAALADVTPALQRRREGYVAPSGAIETRIAEVFAEVLGTARVGALDDFFELGGNSVRAVQAFRKIAVALNTELQIADIFQHARVRDLAARVERLADVTSSASDDAAERSQQQRAALGRQQAALRSRRQGAGSAG